MRFGICTSFDNILIVKNSGFDYIEANASEVTNASESRLREVLNICKDNDMSVSSCNCMFPADIRLTGCDYSLEKIHEHVKRAFYNASILGVENFSLGSGSQRHIEPGDGYNDCFAQFTEATNVIADEAHKYGIIIAIEPLNKGESNLINTVNEGAKVAREIDKPNLMVMADTYHMYVENEDLEILKEHKDILAHVHVANPVGRKYPKEGDGVDYKRLFDILSDIGYDKKLSIEAHTDDFKNDCAICGEYFKEKFIV